MTDGSAQWRRWMACACVAAGAIALGCEQEATDEPRGGGYVADRPAQQESTATSSASADGGGAKSTLGKAKQAAERVIKEDVAEYNKKIEQAADDVFKKP